MARRRTPPAHDAEVSFGCPFFLFSRTPAGPFPAGDPPFRPCAAGVHASTRWRRHPQRREFRVRRAPQTAGLQARHTGCHVGDAKRGCRGGPAPPLLGAGQAVAVMAVLYCDTCSGSTLGFCTPCWQPQLRGTQVLERTLVADGQPGCRADTIRRMGGAASPTQSSL